jgi:hypothetical protein
MLVGPYALEEADSSLEQELLELAPSKHYLTGFLAPAGYTPEEEPEDDAVGAGTDDVTDDGAPADPGRQAARRARFSSSMGVTVIVDRATRELRARLKFADYVAEDEELLPESAGGARKARRTGRPKRRWRRVPRGPFEVVLSFDAPGLTRVPVGGDARQLELVTTVRTVPSGAGLAPGSRAVAVFLVNRRGEDLDKRDEQYVFQVELELSCERGFLGRRDHSGVESDQWDERVSDLQFRDHAEYAVGHGVAIEDPGPERPVRRVRTTWLPCAEVKRVRTHEDARVTVIMEELAELGGAEDVKRTLGVLPVAYGEWIEKQRASTVGDSRREEAKSELLDRAELARERIQSGIDRIARDPIARASFCWMNRAMSMAARRRSPGLYATGKQPAWRLFQLAFVLASLDGVSDPAHADRRKVDLIFFPTGGGKTEAYLGVVGYILLLRRLVGAGEKHGGLGVAVILRYTLRLLTLDQLGRAAALMCALELIRREQPQRLGEQRFAVGLWVGSSATANTLDEVKRKVSEYKGGQETSNPCPLPTCPWCGHKLERTSLTIEVRGSRSRLRVACVNDACEFCAAHRQELPLVFVDEQVYAELPALLIGTVDKFAMLPWRAEAGMLFGRVLAHGEAGFVGAHENLTTSMERIPGGLLPPELILQDELHLISGPLGTMVGLYETAVDALATRQMPDGKEHRPKVVAATATVRRAPQQIHALFGRNASDVYLFPPPSVDESETFFGTVDRDAPSRVYLGVAAQGRSMKAILIWVYETLLTAAARVYDPKGSPGQPADGLMTLVGYFNSLRELGGMRRLVEDDVRTRAARASERKPLNATGEHRWLVSRELNLDPRELTSRASTDAVKRAKDLVSQPWSETKQDVLLASNMISVGVDINRLGLMVVSGQPKTTAEYIQASSRVGRDHERWPGLVVTCYNLFKPRDRSHYERFSSYHACFYRYVEATSVTPFSLPALDRGLAGTLVAMTRFADPMLTPNPAASRLPEKLNVTADVVRVLADRARNQPEISPDDAQGFAQEVAARAENLFETWRLLVKSQGAEPSRRRYSPFDKDNSGGRALLFTALDPDAPDPATPDARFAAPTSMRDVEASAHLWLLGRKLEGKS